MAKIATPVDFTAASREQKPPINYNEGTNVYVTCSQSYSTDDTYRSRSSMCKFDIDPTLHNMNVGFPLTVTVTAKRRSSTSASKEYILDHRADTTFWIPYDCIVSSDVYASDFISKILFLMDVPLLLLDVPFSLDHTVKWIGTSHNDVETTATFNNNKDMLISKLVEFAKGMKDCPALPYEGVWHMCLGVTRVTYLPHLKFMEIYNKMNGIHDNDEAWGRSQDLQFRVIAWLEELVEEADVKKMRFEAAASQGSNDACSICLDKFLEGSMVSCTKQCSHAYHDICILKWLVRNRFCPNCRHQLTEKVRIIRS